jgi:hypothetical protein
MFSDQCQRISAANEDASRPKTLLKKYKVNSMRVSCSPLQLWFRLNLVFEVLEQMCWDTHIIFTI